MSDERRELSTFEIVQALIDQHARVARDIVPIDTNTWAIHGPIAVDGDVIMAEFTSMREAEAAVVQLFAAENETTISLQS
jgi:hypothetical protein